MTDKPEQAQHAQVGNLHLDTWTVNDRHFWSVRDFAKKADIDSGETATIDGAKAAAKKAAPAPARAKEAPTKPVSLEEPIKQRAYDLYVSRGNQSGFRTRRLAPGRARDPDG